MRSKILILVVALVLGGLAAILAARYITGARSTIEAESKPVKVLVAAEDIPRGLSAEELLSKKLILRQEVPARFVAAGAISSERGIEGQVLATPLSKGEQVTRARFQIPSQAGLAYSVPKDVVAITIPVNEERGVAGLVKPGDHVTVFASFKKAGGEADENVTKMLLPGVRVLAVGSSLAAEEAAADEAGGQRGFVSSDRAGAAQQIPTAMTLAVTAPEAERLVFALENGDIWVGLLPATATQLPATKGQTYQSVLR